MRDTSPTRALTASHLWALHTLGYRLDHVRDRSGGWREYSLRHPDGLYAPGNHHLRLCAPPKTRQAADSD